MSAIKNSAILASEINDLLVKFDNSRKKLENLYKAVNALDEQLNNHFKAVQTYITIEQGNVWTVDISVQKEVAKVLFEAEILKEKQTLEALTERVKSMHLGAHS